MNSNTIAKNSFWYGIETITNLLLSFFTSIVIARTIGPENLGYFLYMWWIAGVAGMVGSLGIPAATRKYMSEYSGRGQMGIARTVFYKTLRLQTGIAAVAAISSLFVIWFFGDHRYRLMSLFMIASIFPYMVNSVVAGANAAFEDLRANVPASLVSTGIFVSAVALSIYFGWNLLGISIGLFTMRAAELVVRLIPMIRRLNAYSPEPLDQILSKRMFLFSGQSLVLLLLGLVVWDRSEMIFLKSLCSDIRQVAFYSVAFNLTERLLIFSQIFGTATEATVMAQYGRDSTRSGDLISASVRYLALISFPVHLGLAAIAGPVMWIIYGHKYAGAVPALMVAACLGIPKAFLLPVQGLLASWERQDLIIRWGLVAGVINIALDLALIPRFGAVGAALANGTAQTFSVLALWLAAIHLLKVRVPILPVVKIALISAAMAFLVHFTTSRVAPVPAVILAGLMGAAVLIILIRITGVLDPADHRRMLNLKRHVPSRFGRVLEASLNWLIPIPAPGELNI
jgi:O-antigen/teichoic acid export membrane protein